MDTTNNAPIVLSRRKPGSQARILVVDDDARLRDLLKRFLSEQGYAVTAAASAVEMNRLWIRERYDLLVLDLMLPGEDGMSICGRLRGGGDNTPIIMLTTENQEAKKAEGQAAGAKAWMVKPFKPEQMLMAVSKLCLP